MKIGIFIVSASKEKLTEKIAETDIRLFCDAHWRYMSVKIQSSAPNSKRAPKRARNNKLANTVLVFSKS